MMTSKRMDPLLQSPFVFLTVLIPFLVLLTNVQHTLAAPALEGDDTDGGCYYMFNHYGEGDRILTNEPCLNCTCHNSMLMCYLRVCPFTKPIGQDCTVEKKPDQCCPVISCPQVPVSLVTPTALSSTTLPSTTTSLATIPETTELANYERGCEIEGKYYPDGAQVDGEPTKPCELCYCIRNSTACVMQECILHVEGCQPVFQPGVCCPVRYQCDYPPQLTDQSTVAGLITTTIKSIFSPTLTPGGCIREGEYYADGSQVPSASPCDHCYCMRGEVVCAVQECGAPLENAGGNCTAIPPPPGLCCPEQYTCEGDKGTDGSETTTGSLVGGESETEKPHQDDTSLIVDEINKITDQNDSVVSPQATDSSTIVPDNQVDDMTTTKPEVELSPIDPETAGQSPKEPEDEDGSVPASDSTQMPNKLSEGEHPSEDNANVEKTSTLSSLENGISSERPIESSTGQEPNISSSSETSTDDDDSSTGSAQFDGKETSPRPVEIPASEDGSHDDSSTEKPELVTDKLLVSSTENYVVVADGSKSTEGPEVSAEDESRITSTEKIISETSSDISVIKDSTEMPSKQILSGEASDVQQPTQSSSSVESSEGNKNEEPSVNPIVEESMKDSTESPQSSIVPDEHSTGSTEQPDVLLTQTDIPTIPVVPGLLESTEHPINDGIKDSSFVDDEDTVTSSNVDGVTSTTVKSIMSQGQDTSSQELNSSSDKTEPQDPSSVSSSSSEIPNEATITPVQDDDKKIHDATDFSVDVKPTTGVPLAGNDEPESQEMQQSEPHVPTVGPESDKDEILPESPTIKTPVDSELIQPTQQPEDISGAALQDENDKITERPSDSDVALSSSTTEKKPNEMEILGEMTVSSTPEPAESLSMHKSSTSSPDEITSTTVSQLSVASDADNEIGADDAEKKVFDTSSSLHPDSEHSSSVSDNEKDTSTVQSVIPDIKLGQSDTDKIQLVPGSDNTANTPENVNQEDASITTTAASVPVKDISQDSSDGESTEKPVLGEDSSSEVPHGISSTEGIPISSDPSGDEDKELTVSNDDKASTEQPTEGMHSPSSESEQSTEGSIVSSGGGESESTASDKPISSDPEGTATDKPSDSEVDVIVTNKPLPSIPEDTETGVTEKPVSDVDGSQTDKTIANVESSSTEKPVSLITDVESPATYKPAVSSDVESPGADEPVSSDVETPATDKPVVSDVESPATDKPATSDVESPATDKPVSSDVESPGADEPVSSDVESPATDKPVSSDVESPESDKPVVSSDVESPATDKPVSSEVESPATAKPATSDVESPATDKPVSSDVETPATDKPVSSDVESPATDKPVSSDVESPATDMPASSDAESPATDKPISSDVESPGSDEPASSDVESPATDKPASSDVESLESDKPATSDVESPATDKPVSSDVESPESDKPVSSDVETPATDKPVSSEVETPTTDKPASSDVESLESDKPATSDVESPATDKPVSSDVESPATDKSVSSYVESSATDKPVSSDVESPGADEPASSDVESPATDKPVSSDVESPESDKPATSDVESPATDRPVSSDVETPATDKPVSSDSDVESSATDAPVSQITNDEKITEKPVSSSASDTEIGVTDKPDPSDISPALVSNTESETAKPVSSLSDSTEKPIDTSVFDSETDRPSVVDSSVPSIVSGTGSPLSDAIQDVSSTSTEQPLSFVSESIPSVTTSSISDTEKLAGGSGTDTPPVSNLVNDPTVPQDSTMNGEDKVSQPVSVGEEQNTEIPHGSGVENTQHSTQGEGLEESETPVSDDQTKGSDSVTGSPTSSGNESTGEGSSTQLPSVESMSDEKQSTDKEGSATDTPSTGDSIKPAVVSEGDEVNLMESSTPSQAVPEISLAGDISSPTVTPNADTDVQSSTDIPMSSSTISSDGTSRAPEPEDTTEIGSILPGEMPSSQDAENNENVSPVGVTDIPNITSVPPQEGLQFDQTTPKILDSSDKIVPTTSPNEGSNIGLSDGVEHGEEETGGVTEGMQQSTESPSIVPSAMDSGSSTTSSVKDEIVEPTVKPFDKGSESLTTGDNENENASVTPVPTTSGSSSVTSIEETSEGIQSVGGEGSQDMPEENVGATQFTPLSESGQASSTTPSSLTNDDSNVTHQPASGVSETDSPLLDEMEKDVTVSSNITVPEDTSPSAVSTDKPTTEDGIMDIGVTVQPPSSIEIMDMKVPSAAAADDKTSTEQESSGENEDGESSRVPGEGNCFVEGKTYKNGSSIPPTTPCHIVCACQNSIVHCLLVHCNPPPSDTGDCKPIYKPGVCCPEYDCDQSEVPTVTVTPGPALGVSNDTNVFTVTPETPISEITVSSHGMDGNFTDSITTFSPSESSSSSSETSNSGSQEDSKDNADTKPIHDSSEDTVEEPSSTPSSSTTTAALMGSDTESSSQDPSSSLEEFINSLNATGDGVMSILETSSESSPLPPSVTSSSLASVTQDILSGNQFEIENNGSTPLSPGSHYPVTTTASITPSSAPWPYPTSTPSPSNVMSTGACLFDGRVYMSAQQIPRDDPCDFCFCFRGDIICLQQSCPPPIPGCYEEPIPGFCCPRYECPVGNGNVTTQPPLFPPSYYHNQILNGVAASGQNTGAIAPNMPTGPGCEIQGEYYESGQVITSTSGPCLECRCGATGMMECDPRECQPEPMLRKMIAAITSR